MTDFFDAICLLAEQSLIRELKTSPKYGLVCPTTTGSHSDMDFALMQKGIFAISPFFGKFAKLGFEAEQADENLLAQARRIGVEAEKSMFVATKGINTHKGALFCLGLACVAAGYVKKTTDKISAQSVCQVVAKICTGLCQKELAPSQNNREKTHGQVVFEKYGATGARGLAQNGYAQVTKIYLPTLNRLLKKTDENTAQSRLLALIVAQTEDINILFRTNSDVLTQARTKCHKLYQKYSVDKAEKINRWFVSQNISAGGSADLLSLTLFLHALENF